MRKIASSAAVMAAALLVFSGFALARGGSPGGGRGTGTGGSCTNRVNMATRSCDGTGNCRQMTAARVRTMDGSGQHRHMRSYRAAVQTPQDTAPGTN